MLIFKSISWMGKVFEGLSLPLQTRKRLVAQIFDRKFHVNA